MDCTGHFNCSAEVHTHGCYGDRGICDAPEEHRKEPRSNNDLLANAFDRSIDSIVSDLRNLADRVERAKNISTRINRPYLSNAEGVVSDILNALPNFNFGLLIERAHDAETLMELKEAPDGG